jgi:predicted transcriptional regulator
LKDIRGNDFKTFSFNHNNTIYVDIYENKFNRKQYDCEVKDKKIDDLNNTNDTLSTNIHNLRKDNDKLKNTQIKNDILVKENNKKLKRKLDESDKAFDNLFKKYKK